MQFALSANLDIAKLKAQFAADRAVSISGFLDPEAANLLEKELLLSASWVEIFRAGTKVYEMPQAAFMALSDDQKQALQQLVESSALRGLQYRYRSIRVSEIKTERAERGMILDNFASFLNSDQVIALLREITSIHDVSFADAQATDYRAGDFLTTHDDDVEGKNRRIAYVYGLTRVWQADWGGLLLFENERMVSGFVPDFNVLRLFSVPLRHHVSMVSPWVEARRLSVTGWLRVGEPSGASQSGS